MADYIFQKKGESTWYVRLDVPADVRRAFGNRRVLTQTLKTGLRSEAMERRLPWLTQWKADISAARQSKAGSGDEWRLAQHTAGKDLQQMRAIAVNEIFTPKSPDAPPADLSWFEALPEIVNDLRENGRFDLAERVTNNSKRLLEFYEHGGTAGEGIDITNERQMIIGDIEAACIADEYDLSEKEEEEARSIVRNPTTYKPVSPITAPRLDTFRSYRMKSGVAPKTIDQQESKLRKLSNYLRDQGSPLTRATVAAWLDTMSLSSKTKAQYLLAGSTFWQWAIKHDTHWRSDYSEKDNPFTGQELPKVRARDKAESARKAFTTEEIESLYAAASLSGNSTLCDLILLGSYTGCRIEEIAQLHKDSIITVEGIRTFKITDSKTVAGIREIPIHPSLAEVVDRLIDESTDGFLLPSSSGNKYGIRSDPHSKAFGRLKKAQGFSSRQVFHSVRSMVITLLLRAGVPGPTVANIVGHETGLVTFDVYDEGASPKQKQAALSNLGFNFNR